MKALATLKNKTTLGKRRKKIVEVNLRGHCAFCLNNIVKGEKDSDNVASGYNEDVQEQLVEISEMEGSKLTTVADFSPSPSSNILAFRHLWPYLLEERKINVISEMVFVCKDGSGGDDAAGEVPPMCETCRGILEQLDKLHSGVLKTVEEMKKIIERTHEHEAGSIKGFLNLLKNSNQDTSTANSTITFLEQLGDGRKYSLSHSNDTDNRRRRKRRSSDWKLNAEVVVPLTRLRRRNSKLTTLNNSDQEILGNAFDSNSSNYNDVPVKTEVILENDVDWADDGHAAELIQDDDSFHDKEIKEELEKASTKSRSVARKPRKRKKLVYSAKKKTPIIRTKPLVQGCTRRCEVCGEIVNFQDLLEHMEAHVGDFVVKCPNPKCMFVCSNPRTINKVHFKLVDRIPECTDLAKEFNSKNCEICGKKPTSIVNGRYHAKYHEKTELVKTVSCPLPNCEERFALRASVYEHIFEKHISGACRLPCSLCPRLVKPEISESHLRNDHGIQNPLKCQHRQCSYWLPSWEAIVDHMTSAHRFEDLICFICTDGTKFPRVREFRMHYLTAHKIGKEFICEHCGKGFTLELLLNVHVEVVHPDHATTSIRRPGSDVVMCDLCDDSDINYRSEKRLIAHKIMDHGHAPFVCGICQKKFYSEDARRRHEINSHGSQFGFKDKETHKCVLDNCHKVFDKSGKLRQHQLRHHPEHFTEAETAPKFPCEHCGKKYFFKRALKLHVESEHLNITYMCDICGIKCRRKEGLRIHKRVHTGERPYACCQCDRAYFEKRPLLAHMKTHHQMPTKPEESKNE